MALADVDFKCLDCHNAPVTAELVHRTAFKEHVVSSKVSQVGLNGNKWLGYSKLTYFREFSTID